MRARWATRGRGGACERLRKHARPGVRTLETYRWGARAWRRGSGRHSRCDMRTHRRARARMGITLCCKILMSFTLCKVTCVGRAPRCHIILYNSDLSGGSAVSTAAAAGFGSGCQLSDRRRPPDQTHGRYWCGQIFAPAAHRTRAAACLTRRFVSSQPTRRRAAASKINVSSQTPRRIGRNCTVPGVELGRCQQDNSSWGARACRVPEQCRPWWRSQQ